MKITAPVKKCLSKIRQLREMSGEELKYRLKEKCRIQNDRLQYWLRLNLERDQEFRDLLNAHQGSVKTYLENRAARNFYSSLHPEWRDTTIDVIKRTMPARVYRTIEEAERLAEHRVDLLGYRDVALGKQIDWHRDPVSGHRWEKRFWADFEFSGNPRHDAKLIYQLNRHQFLPRLAKAYLLTQDERFARESLVQMESWIDQNDVWQGLNWHSGLEIAIRVISWLWTVFMLLPSKAFDERVARRICQSLFLQVDRIHRYPPVYRSPDTQLIGQAAALLVAGVVFSDLPRAADWRTSGAAILSEAMNHQAWDDGVYNELSTYSHCYATDFLLQALVLARMNRVFFPDSCWIRLSQMLDFVMHATRPNGTMPLIGDNDAGRALALAADSYNTFSDGLCSGAVLFGRADFKFAARVFAEETFWLLGTDAFSVFGSLESRLPNRMAYAGANGSCIIQRSGWNAADSHMIFKCGRPSDSGRHAHAVELSVCLSAGSARVNNSVVVDGGDQSDDSGSFNRQRENVTRVGSPLTVDGLEYASAEHDGYRRLRQPVALRRRVLYVRPNYWIVLDDLSGAGDHTFDFFYHFAPGTKLFVLGEEGNGDIECRARVDNAGLHMMMHSTAPIEAQVICPHYGERKAAPVLKAAVRGYAPLAAMTFIKPGTGAGLRGRRLSVSGGRALASVVRDGAFEDICVSAIDSTAILSLMDFKLSGELFWMRTENGLLRQLFAVNASEYSWCGETIFQEKQPISHVMVHFWENGMVIERGDGEEKVYVRDLAGQPSRRKGK